MSLQFLGIDLPQQPLSPLIFPNSKFDIQKPMLDYIEDSALGLKVIIHPDGQITFMGTDIVTESCFQKIHSGEKLSLLVPRFSSKELTFDEILYGQLEYQYSKGQGSFLHIEDSIYSNRSFKEGFFTADIIDGPEKVKARPSPKKNKKSGRERDLYKKNHLHACESLLSLIVDKKRNRKMAILSLKKSGPELLTQFSAGIAGTGLAVLLSVICKVAKLLNTGFGFGLVWLSWAVNKLRDTIVGISKNAGKLALKDEEMIHKLDKSLKEIYFRAAALLAVAVLRLA